MITIIGVELVRFASRRAVRVVALISFLLLVLTATLIFWNSSEEPGQFGEDRRFCQLVLLQERESCQQYDRVTDLAQIRPDEPPVQEYPVYDESGGERTITYIEKRQGFTGVVTILGFMAMLIGVVLGSTFIGGEYRAGTLESALVVEPRRSRLLAGRLIAGTVGIAALVAALYAAFVVMLIPTLSTRANTDVPDGFWAATGAGVGRAVLLAAVAGVLGMLVATLTRHTAGAVAGALGYAIASGILVNTVLKPFHRWELLQNVVAALTLGDVGRFVGQVDEVAGDAGVDVVAYAHDWTGALMVVAVYVVALLGASFAVFTRRDIN